MSVQRLARQGQRVVRVVVVDRIAVGNSVAVLGFRSPHTNGPHWSQLGAVREAGLVFQVLFGQVGSCLPREGNVAGDLVRVRVVGNLDNTRARPKHYWVARL